MNNILLYLSLFLVCSESKYLTEKGIKHIQEMKSSGIFTNTHKHKIYNNGWVPSGQNKEEIMEWVLKGLGAPQVDHYYYFRDWKMALYYWIDDHNEEGKSFSYIIDVTSNRYTLVDKKENKPMNNDIVMEVKVLEEAGYDSAMQGIGLSYGKPSNAKKVSKKLCFKDGGHNKFLESMMIWVKVKAPRYWWQEADTYRVSTKQSESTMHTIMRQINTEDNYYSISRLFEEKNISMFTVEQLIIHAKEKNLVTVKQLLPEGFLQTRIWCFSYKTLRSIILQRRDHRLPHWKSFIDQIKNQIQHEDLLP